MYADVVVLTYQSPTSSTFTYKIPQDLIGKIKPGSLVTVPFGKRNPFGIVGATNYQLQTTNYKLKSISSLVFPIPLLLPYQISLLKWMSQYYRAPIVNCLEAMLPEIPKKLSMVHGSLLMEKKVNKTMNYKLSTMNQTLILLPSINRIPETLAKFPNAKNYVVFHNELKTSQKFEAWLRILTNDADYIFGSRSTIFAPCPNLKKIIIFDEHDTAYKDERSPYYDTITVTEKICTLTGTKLEIVDNAPKITTYFNHKKEITIPKFQVKTKIVSMIEERNAGNKSPLSETLINGLKFIASRNGKSLLFLNKKSQSGYIYCRNCKHQEFASKEPPECPNCHSPEIWFNTTNITSLANLVKKLLPDTNIQLIAEGIKLSTINPLRQRSEASYQLSTISIATSHIFYALSQIKYDLVANVSTDHLLNLPDFLSNEKLFEQITSLKKITKRFLILQTFNPEHPTITNAASGNYKEFFDRQIKERQSLKYPPFSLLIKLSLKGKDAGKLEQKADKLFDQLSTISAATFAGPDISEERRRRPADINYELSTIVLGPFKPFLRNRSSRYNIILKVPVSNYSLYEREKALKKATSILEKIPKEWQVVVEPESLN